MAEYRTGHSGQAFEHLMANVNLTYRQDLGAVTELLSGEYYEPFGRSSSHQMWSSAMVLIPAIRGMLGINPGGPAKPQLPKNWQKVTVHNASRNQSDIVITNPARN